MPCYAVRDMHDRIVRLDASIISANYCQPLGVWVLLITPSLVVYRWAIRVSAIARPYCSKQCAISPVCRVVAAHSRLHSVLLVGRTRFSIP